MWIFLEVQNYYREGEELFGRAAQIANSLRGESGGDRKGCDILFGHMTTHQAYFFHRQVHPRQALTLLEPVLALLRQHDDLLTLSQSLWTHGSASWFYGDFAAAVWLST